MSGNPGTDPGDGERRSFVSRTPSNSNPDRATYRRGFVTRHQVTGWRFVMRRIASGVALHDTRMLVDPLRTQSRAVLMGALIVITGLLGCFVFSLIRPSGTVGNNAVLADRSTSALYVRIDDELHPVLNLTSARLIVGDAVDPVTVKSVELDKFPRGAMVGIPGAPERMVQNTSRDADWTVCEGAAADATVISGKLVGGGERAAVLGPAQAVLVDNGAGTWLLWDGRRSFVDLGNGAVTSALGFGPNEQAPRPISPALFNAIPESPALLAPYIAGAGTPPQFPVPAPAAVGAVVVSYAIDGAGSENIDSLQYYAVLPDGLQPISPVLAAILRNTDSYGLDQPPMLGADVVAHLPVSRALDTAVYPDHRLTLTDPVAAPVTCAYWTKSAGATTSSLRLLAGAVLPVADGLRTVDLVGGGGDGTAARVALPPGTGYLAQTAGAGSLFWIADTGVRYGIDETGGPNGENNTLEALGSSGPALPIPWSMLSLFSAGPTLSRSDALVAPAFDNRESR